MSYPNQQQYPPQQGYPPQQQQYGNNYPNYAQPGPQQVNFNASLVSIIKVTNMKYSQMEMQPQQQQQQQQEPKKDRSCLVVWYVIS